MTPDEAIAFFGTQVKLAERLGIAQSSVAEWAGRGYIPYPRQFQIQIVTDGQLVADECDPAPRRSREAA